MHNQPTLHITQQQLAEVGCLSLRHVNSSLKNLEDNGLIERFKGGLIVLNEKDLFVRAGHLNLSEFGREGLVWRTNSPLQ